MGSVTENKEDKEGRKVKRGRFVSLLFWGWLEGIKRVRKLGLVEFLCGNSAKIREQKTPQGKHLVHLGVLDSD